MIQSNRHEGTGRGYEAASFEIITYLVPLGEGGPSLIHSKWKLIDRCMNVNT